MGGVLGKEKGAQVWAPGHPGHAAAGSPALTHRGSYAVLRIETVESIVPAVQCGAVPLMSCGKTEIFLHAELCGSCGCFSCYAM